MQQRGRGRTEEISSQKLADFECRFPYDSYGRGRAPFWPFLGEGFSGACSRGPLVYCWFLVGVRGSENSQNFLGGSKCFCQGFQMGCQTPRWSNPTRGLDIEMDGTFSVALYIASQEPIVRARGSLRISFCHDQPWWCTFVYPYPSVSALAGGNSDHGPRKTRTKTQTTPDSVFIGETRNSDHGLSSWGGETQTMVWVSGVFGVGVDEGALNRDDAHAITHIKHTKIWSGHLRAAPLVWAHNCRARIEKEVNGRH